MNIKDFLKLFDKGKRRYYLLGDECNGVVIALDLEGRFFTFINGEVVSKINPDAVLNQTTRAEYLNPGGDGLWPAPEGTRFGYEYSTKHWRVPPGLSNASYIVTSGNRYSAKVQAEIDLINAQGLGIPTIFSRTVNLENSPGKVKMSVHEEICYIGRLELSKDQCMLAVWSLAQFEASESCYVTAANAGEQNVWDLYDASDRFREFKDGICTTQKTAEMRYQIAMDDSIEYIEFNDPERGIKARRSATASDCGYSDISDSPPDQEPSARGVCYSVYNDTGAFMEIEASGGSPESFTDGSKSALHIVTEYSI